MSRSASAIFVARPAEPGPLRISRQSASSIRIHWQSTTVATWQIQTSVDGLGEWEDEPEAAGSLRVVPANSRPFFYRLLGLDGEAVPVTEYSNTLNMP